MTEWLVSIVLIVAAFFWLPMSMRSTKRWQKGRTGILASFADGLTAALDPRRPIVVEEMEKRQDMEGEEVDGHDEPLPSAQPSAITQRSS